MDALTISGRVDESGRFLHGDKERLRDFLKSCAGQMVTMTVKLGRSKASQAQFGWYRGVALPMLAEKLGYDKHEIESLHEGVLIACYGSKPDPLDGRPIPAHRTRHSDTKVMAEFQEWFMRWCATEHELYIPEPNEDAA